MVMPGGVPGGEAMHCSLLVGLTWVSTMTYLESLLHARFFSGCAVEVALLWGYSRLIGGHAGSGLGGHWGAGCVLVYI